MPRHDDPRRRCLPLAEWPPRDRALWERAIAEAGRRFGRRPDLAQLRPTTIEKYREGYGRFLGFLAWNDRLDPDASPRERADPDTLDDYFAELIELGNADHTVSGRFAELEGALRVLDPEGPPRLRGPSGQPVSAWLAMTSREIAIHHPLDLFLWGLDLMKAALDLKGPQRRRVMLRDGLLIAILAARGLRLRSVVSLELDRNVVRSERGWRLDLSRGDTKNTRRIDVSLGEVLTPWIDRYVAVERAELLGPGSSRAFWINWGGEPLGEKGLDKRIRWLSAKRFGPGKAFGTHRFRHCIASATPLLLPEYPGLGAALLRISHGVFAGHYDRSEDVLAFRQYHATLAAERRRSREDGMRALEGLFA